ncbi:hypothetical protein ACU11_05235 [Xanthomonas oryzae pv. oryzicola]|nr:hypothetical protein ACU11_05235 [Xanthomonas oryzae pv. oryzicola]OLK23810.1 hypothetical protein IXO621_05840 [Xanthomonas oryzae pv. oryzae]OLK43435.1 hypothetical protein IXO620_15510 [Xanthomonas oryzae pv. oryzae]PUE97105.1 hypothetical protein C7T79_06195 [Xanthomonas oryzae pv. oryzicola]
MVVSTKCILNDADFALDQFDRKFMNAYSCTSVNKPESLFKQGERTAKKSRSNLRNIAPYFIDARDGSMVSRSSEKRAVYARRIQANSAIYQ